MMARLLEALWMNANTWGVLSADSEPTGSGYLKEKMTARLPPQPLLAFFSFKSIYGILNKLFMLIRAGWK